MLHSAKKITIFNHKGGVGKTTLTVNIAAALAQLDKRVLLVDSDPQCNLTSYLVEDGVVDAYLDTSDSPEGRTLWSCLKPLAEGTGDTKKVDLHETATPGLYLLPGDIRLSEFELLLNSSWTECLRRLLRGFHVTTALSELLVHYGSQYNLDYVFYDAGPNIGPLNRVILLDSDFFIVPAACDLFSVRAFKTLGKTLSDWMKEWQLILQFAPSGIHLLPGCPKYLGYIPQSFRVYGGEMTQWSLNYLRRIDRHIYSDIIGVLEGRSSRRGTKLGDTQRLGEVKNFASLVQMAQTQGVPLWKVKGGNSALASEAEEVFGEVAKRILERTSEEIENVK